MIAGVIASLCVAALVLMALRAVRALWEDQYRAEAQTCFRRTAWVPMLMLLGIAGAALGYYGWRAVQVHAPTDHPALEVKATCQDGVWSFAAQGGVRGATRDLRLRGGRDVALRLQAGAHPTEFFVPGLGLKRRLGANERAELTFRPPAPTRADAAALYRSVCLHNCRGEHAVRPFVVVVEAPRGILAF